MDNAQRIALMVDKGKRRILSSGDWITFAELGQLTARRIDEVKTGLRSLLRDGRICAIDYDDIDYFPIHAFDARGDFEPVPAKAAIEVLATRKNAWSMAL